MEANEDAVVQFCGVTTATPDQAKFYLESSDWQLDHALQLFFESDGGQGRATPLMSDYEAEDENMSISSGSPAPAAPCPGAWNCAPPAGPTQGIGSYSTRKTKGKEKGTSKKSGNARGLVTTLRDLGKHQDSDSDSDGPQEYYTGGEKSGMMVQDPTRKHKHRDVDAMFERVRKLGAQEGTTAETAHVAAPASGQWSTFSGTSRTLTGEPRQAEPAAESAVPREPPNPSSTQYTSGGTVSLLSINKSECPRELEPANRNVPVHVNLVKKEEEWQAPPEPKYVAFKGLGHTLGNTPQTTCPEEVTPGSPTREPTQRPVQGLVLDEAKPATAIQLRLSDGTRMVARFNTTHTVADIRGFIDAARPGASVPYQLQTMGFPPTKLNNPKQTIEGAGLINAVVIQKA